MRLAIARSIGTEEKPNGFRLRNNAMPTGQPPHFEAPLTRETLLSEREAWQRKIDFLNEEIERIDTEDAAKFAHQIQHVLRKPDLTE